MKEEIRAITARIPAQDYAELERIAAKRDINLTQAIRMLLGVGIECHKDMEKLGLIGVVDFVYYVKEAVKSKSTGKQLKLPI